VKVIAQDLYAPKLCRSGVYTRERLLFKNQKIYLFIFFLNGEFFLKYGEKKTIHSKKGLEI